MTLEEANITVEGLMEVRDRPLVDAYETHDVGYEILVQKLETHGFHVVDHGDDARHADDVFYGDGPDLAVYEGYDEHEEEPHGLVAYIEIKCKEIAEWFGRCNHRHFKEYVNFSNEVDVPVFIWFALVGSERNLLERQAFFEVEGTSQIDGRVVDITESEVVFYAEDTYEVDDGLLAVDAEDLVGVQRDKTVVDSIPNVHGNDVVCLNEDQLRSFPYFLHRTDTN